MFDARTNLSLAGSGKCARKCQAERSTVPSYREMCDWPEAPSHGYPITIYDPKSAGAESYRALAEEVISREE